MLSRTTTCQQPLKRSIVACQKHQFSQSYILTQPQYHSNNQQQHQAQEESSRYSYLRYFQLKKLVGGAGAGATYTNQAGVSNASSCGATSSSLNSSRIDAKQIDQDEKSWRYVDLVHPHVAEFADLF